MAFFSGTMLFATKYGQIPDKQKCMCWAHQFLDGYVCRSLGPDQTPITWRVPWEFNLTSVQASVFPSLILRNQSQNLNLKLRLDKPYKGQPTLSPLSLSLSLSLSVLSLLKLAVYSATAGNRPKPESKHS